MGKIADAIGKDLGKTPLFNALGVHDLFLQFEGDDLLLFASFERWNADEKCFVLIVSMLRLATQNLFGDNEPDKWETVFESFPCLSAKDKKNPVAAHQAGGRIDRFSNGKIILSVGDYEFEGVNGKNLAADSRSAYGKTFIINYSNKTFEVYSTGHRNPQGLLSSQAGDFWLTEHGPTGGDELNFTKESQELRLAQCYLRDK